MEIKKIFAVPHFHFDVEWWKTCDGYAKDAANIVLEALRILDERADFKYVLDQALAVKPFLEAHPEKRDELLKCVGEGRIELVGGTLGAPDENLPTGESLVRQFVYGKKFLRDVFGADCVTAWMMDEFGHSAQLPQILRKCGFKYLAFSRGLRWYEEHPIDFHWGAPDGSKILTHWFCTSYTSMLPAGLTKGWRMRSYEGEIKTDILWEGRLSPTENLLFTFGGDFTVPKREWVEFVDRWNASNEPRIIFSTPKEFFSGLEKRDLPTVEGEFNPVFTGCYESREKIKKLCRETQNRILEAEKLCSIAYLLGGDYPSFEEAWEKILVNDFHDLVCGTGSDRVYKDTLMRYAIALAKINENERNAWVTLSSRIKTDEIDGNPIVVFNALSWPRKGVVALDGEFRVFEPSGREVPSQVINRVTIFLAEVPSLGYSTFYLVGGESEKKETSLKFGKRFLENEYHRVEIDDHGISRVYDKETEKEVLDTEDFLGNELVVDEDVGNLWTVCKTGRVFRDGYPTEVELVERGPVRATVEIRGEHHQMDRTQRISLYSGMKGVFFETHVDFRGRDKRVRVVFPTKVRGVTTYEVPYSALDRPDGHWPAQNWVDISDGDQGVAILNRGNPSHEVLDGTIGLTLLRSVSVFTPSLVLHVLKKLRDVMRTWGQAVKMLLDGHRSFEEYIMDHHYLTLREFASSGGLELGIGLVTPDHMIPYLTPLRRSDAWERGNHEFEYAIYPHRGNWTDADLPRIGHEFNNPLLVEKASRQDGELPGKFSFLEVSGVNAIVNVVKKAEGGGGLVARIYETQGKDVDLTLKFFKRVNSARKLSMTEDEEYAVLRPVEKEIGLKLGKLEISTLLLELS